MSDMYKQEELFSALDNGNEPLTDDTGCCSRCRECSDAGVCLVPDADYSANCIYRNSLKRGKIFYGKRASDFSAFEYEEILNRIDKLKHSDRVAFDEMVIDFCEYNRGAPYRIVRNQHISALSSVGVFTFHAPKLNS